jgi:hypothetical protein
MPSGVARSDVIDAHDLRSLSRTRSDGTACPGGRVKRRAPAAGPARKVGARDPGERCRVLGAVVANVAADRFELGDPRIDQPFAPLQHRRELRAEWLVRAAEVLTRQLLDLLDREPERAQPLGDLRAPRRGLVEEPILETGTRAQPPHRRRPGSSSRRHRAPARRNRFRARLDGRRDPPPPEGPARDRPRRRRRGLLTTTHRGRTRN